MIRKILAATVLAVAATATAQIAATHQQRVQRYRDLRLEHANVPAYPQLARTARVFGTVLVEVTVKDGTVIKTQVKSGPPLLARSTEENIRSWRFNSLVNTTFTTKFVYQLETKEQLDPQNPRVELQLPLIVKITAVPVQLDTNP